MGLADLKKNSTRSNAQMQLAMSIDDFIDGANRYAMGLPQQRGAVISLEELRHRGVANQLAEPRRTPPFRKATFTLSESAIAHLAEMATDCDIAKSKLMRYLIEYHYQLSPEERQLIEQQLKID
jgi:hypothetical protein